MYQQVSHRLGGTGNQVSYLKTFPSPDVTVQVNLVSFPVLSQIKPQAPRTRSPGSPPGGRSYPEQRGIDPVRRPQLDL